ncbi:MAG: hypothetical protein O2856_00925 [Planctomycetota bacterium]|nr:hypothetical protein [Planctomycetota bacterium]
MRIRHITILLILASVCTIMAAAGQETLITLQEAKEQGRSTSRFLKQTKDAAKVIDSIPKANVAFFQELVEPILNKSCLACHGPAKSEGRLRIDQLNPDLLTGPDVERWREVFNARSKSEMPPEDEPDYALADADRGMIVDWLSSELNSASLKQ